ncbi:hypothetical protein DLM45_07410 [Hyphomicrobium methylovorum]|uniref:hypothetical protein n=1 Tax=Hyphomicrobium methylovorum TaxID=84 RepID=UPI0015E66C7A|nr:hypothetical protein [Hyphomicrobium methylovorum]MBA2126050.1 hypothetical protein [Hyphomicrobium methylovorum]
MTRDAIMTGGSMVTSASVVLAGVCIEWPHDAANDADMETGDMFFAQQFRSPHRATTQLRLLVTA